MLDLPTPPGRISSKHPRSGRGILSRERLGFDFSINLLALALAAMPGGRAQAPPLDWMPPRCKPALPRQRSFPPGAEAAEGNSCRQMTEEKFCGFVHYGTE